MIKRFTLLTSLVVLLISTNLFSQARIENKLTFYDAESWILFEDYKEAIQQYLKLTKFYPDNSNYKYRIGQCYINIPGEKEKAIGFLEDAVKNINPKYKAGRFRETGAPYDALYYLANAYRVNNQLDKALETYKVFKKNLDPEVYDSTIVNQQIQSCLNAKELIGTPLFLRQKNLGNVINEANSDFNPVISDDENTMIFSRSEAFYDAIMYASKTNGTWNDPLNMNELLKVDRDIFPTSISSDGKTIYLYSSEDYDGVILTSTFENGVWSSPVKLNGNINTKYWESHATISHDNKKLYFTSNRKGSMGNSLDIYVSERDSTGDWGPAVNLGPVINTPYNEETPFLSKDDKTLFFSSRGHFNMGGYDIFYSTLLDNGQWSAPLNVGYPLNSTDDDVFYKPVNDGFVGYFAKYDPDGFGKQDIYRLEIYSDEHPRKFLIRGMARVSDLMSNFRDSIKIVAMNIKNPDQMIVVYTNPVTGEYEFEVPQGRYKITYDSPNGKKVTKDLDLALTNPSDSFIMPGTILPKTDFVADLLVESNKTISVVKGDSILFPLKVEPNSILTIERWAGDSLVSTKSYTITDSTYNYKMAPVPGDNKIVFRVTDKYSNVSTTDVLITRQKRIVSQPIVRPEYSRIIAGRQIDALEAMLKNRADNNLSRVISRADLKNRQMSNVDDLIAFIKEEAAKDNISPEEVDKTALKVASMDNVLTQAAVDLLAKYAEGDMKRILEDIDIYKLNLKTWTDLQQYVLDKSNGKITADDLNNLVKEILAGQTPSVVVIKEKIKAYSEGADNRQVILKAVETTDAKPILKAGKWLQSVYYESVNQGLSNDQLAGMLALISTFPGTKVETYAGDLAINSDEPLRSWINGLDLKKEKIKTPAGLILYLLQNKDKAGVSDEVLFSSLAKHIAAQDIPSETIKTQMIPEKGTKLWFLWLILGAGIIFIVVIFSRKKKKEVKE
jgi:tetratricopeptide (TPR) repeat protein